MLHIIMPTNFTWMQKACKLFLIQFAIMVLIGCFELSFISLQFLPVCETS